MRLYQIIIILTCAIFFLSCKQREPKQHVHGKFMGLYFDHGVRKGRFHIDASGTKYNYRSISTTITNDTLIPVSIRISLLNEYTYPKPFKNQTFRVFLFPEKLTADKNDEDKLLNTFLNNYYSKPFLLDTIIHPEKELTITIGVLTSVDYPEPGQFALMTKELKPRFFIGDSLIKTAMSTSRPLDLFLGLSFYKSFNDSANSCTVIPCGKIFF